MYTLEIFCKGKKCDKVFSFLNSLRNLQGPMLERFLMNISHIGKASATQLLSSMKILTLEQNLLHAIIVGEILVFYKKHPWMYGETHEWKRKTRNPTHHQQQKLQESLPVFCFLQKHRRILKEEKHTCEHYGTASISLVLFKCPKSSHWRETMCVRKPQGLQLP